jgi:hypothetical protein
MRIVKRKGSPKKGSPKRVLRLPDLDHAKRTVLDSLGSPDSARAYAFAMNDFIAWYCSEPRLAFRKHVVLRYRIELSRDFWRRQPSMCAWPACGVWPTRRPTVDCLVRNWPPASSA